MPSPHCGRYPGLLLSGLSVTSAGGVVRSRLPFYPLRTPQPLLPSRLSSLSSLSLSSSSRHPHSSFLSTSLKSLSLAPPRPHRFSYGYHSSSTPPSPVHHSHHFHSKTCLHPRPRPRPRPLTHNFSPNKIMAAGQDQTRAHGGGHHHHHHDNVYLTSKNKNDAAVRITRLGLYSNLAMAIIKAAGGYYFNSQSMIADAWHSLTDLASDILTLATVSWSIKPPTDAFPAGFGKVESLGSLGVSGMLLAGGVFMCMGSCETIYAHFLLDPAQAAEFVAHSHGHSHSHGHDHDGPSIHAAWLAAGTVLVKEWLYHATMKVARDRKSSVLASNAVHHRIDSLTGIVALFAILGANFLNNAAWLDPVGGLLISLMVIKAGFSNTVSAVYELADKSIDDDVRKSVRKHALASLATVSEGHQIEIRDISGVKSGQNYLVDIEVAVPGGWTVEDCREVEQAVRDQVGNRVRGARRIRVRFVAKDQEATLKFDEFISGSVSPPPSDTEEEHNHDHDHGDKKGH